jgi:hypothetical protein
MFTTVTFPIPTPDPGEDPRLMEANITADIVDQAQPFAAFATALPGVSPDMWPFGLGWSLPGSLFQPIRYLIYPS